jgi:hypothetical protein
MHRVQQLQQAGAGLGSWIHSSPGFAGQQAWRLGWQLIAGSQRHCRSQSWHTTDCVGPLNPAGGVLSQVVDL